MHALSYQIPLVTNTKKYPVSPSTPEHANTAIVLTDYEHGIDVTSNKKREQDGVWVFLICGGVLWYIRDSQSPCLESSVSELFPGDLDRLLILRYLLFLCNAIKPGATNITTFRRRTQNEVHIIRAWTTRASVG